MAGCALSYYYSEWIFVSFVEYYLYSSVSFEYFVLIIEILYSILAIEILYSICNFPALVIGCGTHVSFFTPLPNQHPPPFLPFFFSLSLLTPSPSSLPVPLTHLGPSSGGAKDGRRCARPTVAEGRCRAIFEVDNRN